MFVLVEELVFICLGGIVNYVLLLVDKVDFIVLLVRFIVCGGLFYCMFYEEFIVVD